MTKAFPHLHAKCCHVLLQLLFPLLLLLLSLLLFFRSMRRVPSFSARFPEHVLHVSIFSVFFRTHATDTVAFVRFPEHDRFFLRSSVLFAFNSGVVGGQYRIMHLSAFDFSSWSVLPLFNLLPSGATLAVFMQGS
jgi:hypothetical protein